MISIESSGNFKNIEAILDNIFHHDLLATLHMYGVRGVAALKNATPKDSGETANSWYYEVDVGRTSSTIRWKNSNIVDGVPIAIILQYGHATGNGGYVQGVDYINPALKPIFQSIADTAWKDVTKN